MTSVGALMARLAVLAVTVGAGTTMATFTGVPVLTPLVVTTAVNRPLVVGGLVNNTCIHDEPSPFEYRGSTLLPARYTFAVAPLESTTVLLAAIGSKLIPLMTSTP